MSDLKHMVGDFILFLAKEGGLQTVGSDEHLSPLTCLSVTQSHYILTCRITDIVKFNLLKCTLFLKCMTSQNSVKCIILL